MATDLEVSDLRIAIAEHNNTPPTTDEELKALIDSAGTVRRAAATWWRSKAGSVAHLVNISEGGSSRSNSQLHTNYLKMAEQYTDIIPEETVATSTRPRTRRIERA